MSTPATLCEQFAETGTREVEFNGQSVCQILYLAVSDGIRVRVHRTEARPNLRQALKLGVDHGALSINNVSAPVISLWSDTSPLQVELTVVGSQASRLEVWNAWDMGGLETSWLGNAGMVVTEAERHINLACSDGVGPVDFTNLVVNLAVAKPRNP